MTNVFLKSAYFHYMYIYSVNDYNYYDVQRYTVRSPKAKYVHIDTLICALILVTFRGHVYTIVKKKRNILPYSISFTILFVIYFALIQVESKFKRLQWL